MFLKALREYKQVFGPNYTKYKTLRNLLCALDTIVVNKALVKIKEYAETCL